MSEDHPLPNVVHLDPPPRHKTRYAHVTTWSEGQQAACLHASHRYVTRPHTLLSTSIETGRDDSGLGLFLLTFLSSRSRNCRMEARSVGRGFQRLRGRSKMWRLPLASPTASSWRKGRGVVGEGQGWGDGTERSG